MNDLIPLPKCHVSRVGAAFDESITFDEWTDVGKKIVQVGESIQWVIGDWLNFGFARYCEAVKDKPDAAVYRVKYRIAQESLAVPWTSLTHYSWVAKSVNPCRRLQELSFGHHEAVASLPPVKQKKYLAIAASKSPRMTIAELRALVRENEATCDHGKEECARPDGMMTHLAPLSIWVKQQNPGDWTQKRRDAVKAELAPLVEFYNRL